MKIPTRSRGETFLNSSIVKIRIHGISGKEFLQQISCSMGGVYVSKSDNPMIPMIQIHRNQNQGFHESDVFEYYDI